MLLGRRRAGWAGLVIGGACFITPAMIIVGALAWAYTRWGTTSAGQGLLYGIKPVVIAIIAQALWGLARTAIKGRVLLVGGGVAGFAAYLLGVNVLIVMVVVGGGVTLAVNIRYPPRSLAGVLPVLSSKVAEVRHHPSLVAVLVEFAKLGCVVFGSGYVLLAFLRGDLVGHNGWITSRQLLDAVSIGQFTPGPVFTTATFIGYLSAGIGGAVAATAGIFARRS
jgi:chromate transporter